MIFQIRDNQVGPNWSVFLVSIILHIVQVRGTQKGHNSQYLHRLGITLTSLRPSFPFGIRKVQHSFSSLPSFNSMIRQTYMATFNGMIIARIPFTVYNAHRTAAAGRLIALYVLDVAAQHAPPGVVLRPPTGELLAVGRVTIQCHVVTSSTKHRRTSDDFSSGGSRRQRNKLNYIIVVAECCSYVHWHDREAIMDEWWGSRTTPSPSREVDGRAELKHNDAVRCLGTS